LTAAIAAAHVVAASVGQLFVLRVLFGLGAASVMPAANSIIRNVTDDRNLGKAYGLTTLFTSSAWAIGPFLGGYADAWVSGVSPALRFRSPFLLMALGLVAAALIVRWCVADQHNDMHAAPTEPEAEKTAE